MMIVGHGVRIRVPTHCRYEVRDVTAWNTGLGSNVAVVFIRIFKMKTQSCYTSFGGGFGGKGNLVVELKGFLVCVLISDSGG